MSYDQTFTPPSSALTVWADPRYIYVLLPTKPGAEIPDPILTFPRSPIGLSKVLNLIYGAADYSGKPITEGKKLVGTPMQHALAQSILRRQGMIK